ncbi:hypothetical protein, partial [Vreelandella zhaodongensis]|uniref:hypothetical protein n=1 Tax=Vreelandella zhaodongensis TaxID=1176240 RepID=UPI0036DD928B
MERGVGQQQAVLGLLVERHFIVGDVVGIWGGSDHINTRTGRDRCAIGIDGVDILAVRAGGL